MIQGFKDSFEADGHFGEQALPGFGQTNGAVLAVRQCLAECLFELANRETDSWLRDTEFRRGLEDAGFTVVNTRDTVAESLAYGARAKAQVERGDKPPHRAIGLIHNEVDAPVMMTNTSRGVKEGRLVPIEVFCTKGA